MATIWFIFSKEWREMLRDHRVIFGVFVGPFLFTLGMFAIMGATMRQVGKTVREEVVPLAVVRPDMGQALVQPLEKSGRFRIISVASRKAGEELLQSGRARLVLAFTENAMVGIIAEKPVPVELVYDPASRPSDLARTIMERFLDETNRKLAGERLRQRDVDPAVLEPFRLKSHSLEGRSESFLTMMVPYFLMLWSLVGGVTIASDLVAGEKERGTMETLLTSPVSRLEIVAGKFLALLSQSWTGLASVLGGLTLGWLLIPDDARAATASGLSLSPGTLVPVLLVMLPYTVFSMALLFALATYARNQREAQGYLGLVMFAFMMPIMLGQFLSFFEFSRQWWIGLVPVLNVNKVIHGALTRNLDWRVFALTVASMSLLATAALSIAARLFKRETVLFRV